MTKVEHYVQEAINIANDDSHGYSMQNRDGNPDYDCSSLICHVVQNAGIPVMDKGASYTGNMLGAFLQCGFKDVTGKVGLNSGNGLERGDILLNFQSHSALYIGDGQVVNAGGDNGHPQPGDQGGEIRIQRYWNHPWNAVLRYTEETESDSGEAGVPKPQGQVVFTGTNVPRPDIPRPDEAWAAETNNYDYPMIIKFGDMGTAVQEMQAKFNAIGYPCGNTDGIFGEKTLKAVVDFQTQKQLLVDGEAGPETLGKLYECYKSLTGLDEAFYAQWDSAGVVAPTATPKESIGGFYLGETVEFVGGGAYLLPNGAVNKTYESGTAKITSIKAKAKHPVHLVFTRGAATKVYGWVNLDQIKKV